MEQIAFNSNMENITTMGTAQKKNYKKLPEVAYFRVQSRGAVGTMAELHDRKVGAWTLLVSCKDGKGLRLVSDVAYEHGMKIKGEFKTREEAIAAGKEAIAKWGKVSATTKATKAVKAEDMVAKMSEEQLQQFMALCMARLQGGATVAAAM